MKQFYSVIFLPFFIILLLVTPVNGSSDWEQYGSSKFIGVFSYDKLRIEHRTQDIVQVWTRIVLSDEGRKGYIQSMRDKGVSTKRCDKLSYVDLLKEIDCKKKMYRLLSRTAYHVDGSILDGGTLDNQIWDYLVPDSIYGNLQQKICK